METSDRIVETGEPVSKVGEPAREAGVREAGEPAAGDGARPAKIPFNRPYTTGEEFAYIQRAIDNLHLSGNGPFTERCSDWFQKRLGCARALLTFSCTSALEMAMLLADLRPGEEVLLPSFTFPTTASAVALRGAVPVFVDIRPDTLNLDERLLEDAIGPRTRAILPVHYAGVACAMDVILDIAARHGLVTIEDAAQGISATWRGRPLGSLGDLGALSFHETKNLTCGEGGALLVNRAEWVERAEILQEKGTNRSQFLRGQVDKYTWVDIGSSYVLSDMLAAFLLGQLENMEKITARRREIYLRYASMLAPLVESGLIRTPFTPEHCTPNYHMFYLLAADLAERTELIAHLLQAGILAVFHYVPLHSSPFAKSLDMPQLDLPVTDDTSNRLLRLPMYYDLSDRDVTEVAGAVLTFYKNRRSV